MPASIEKEELSKFAVPPNTEDLLGELFAGLLGKLLCELLSELPSELDRNLLHFQVPPRLAIRLLLVLLICYLGVLTTIRHIAFNQISSFVTGTRVVSVAFHN